MGSKKIDLNLTFALGKDKKTGNWEVGQWANQSLWSVDGTNRRIAAFKDMTSWRYFVRSIEHDSDVELEPGDRVSVTSDKGIGEWYYVVYSLKTGDGKYKYLVAM